MSTLRPILISLTLLLCSASSYPCTCARPSPACSIEAHAALAVRARVLDITPFGGTFDEVKNPDGTMDALTGPGYYRARLIVLENFKGSSQAAEITVDTPEQSSACGFPFTAGAEYLVFASFKEGRFVTSACSGTHQLGNANEDRDISWLRALPYAPAGARIFGTLRPPLGDPHAKLSATIHVRGPAGREVNVDANGLYSVPGLPSGEYIVSADFPAGFKTQAERKVTLAEKSCAQMDWFLAYDSHIRGYVRDSEGRPLPNLLMALKQRSTESATGLRDAGLQTTNTDGFYDFDGVLPGDYLIAANELGPTAETPFPRLYYPGKPSDPDAVGVHLEPAGIVENVSFSFPKPWKTVTIKTRITLPDGSPARDAQVEAADFEYSFSSSPFAAAVNSDGQVTLRVYEGRTYYLTAHTSDGNRQRCAGPLQFSASSDQTLPSLVMEHEWGNCLAQLNEDFHPLR